MTKLITISGELWLSSQAQQSSDEEISSYAKLHGGSSVDLDPAIELLAVEHWLELDNEQT